MRLASCWPRRRNAFTLIELLVVMVLILVIASIGLGYIVFGQDNQHSVAGAQAVTGALLNAKQRAKRDGLPTGVRILFGTPGLPPPQTSSTQAGQLQLIQQPEDYVAGLWTGGDGVTTPLSFSNVDFLGGADPSNPTDQATVQAGDYFVVPGSPFPHEIKTVNYSLQTLTLMSSVLPITPPASGSPYAIIRSPRRLPSEDIIQLPSTVVIDNSVAWVGAPPIPGFNYSNVVRDIVFAPSGAVIGQGTNANKIFLWLRDPNPKLNPVANQPPPGAPLILSVQIRTGFIGVYPVAPWIYNTQIGGGNDPYAYVNDPRSSGL